jgi:protein PhnA
MYNELKTLLENRKTPRYVDRDDIPRDDINKILDAAKLAPSFDKVYPYEIYVLTNSQAGINKKEELDNAHWACLNEAMWSEIPAVQVVSWRLLNRLKDQSWAADALDMMYFDDDTMAWAKSTGDHENDGSVELHKDSNGMVLQDGDTVVLTKSLDVKGSTLNAKLGTVVKNIRLVADNTEQIEGKIEGQTIVILTKYLRKG